VRRRSLDRDLDEELRFHFDMKTRETGDRVAARRALGSALLVRERAHDAWGWRWLDDLRWDVRYALRQFQHNPRFTAAAVVMLAVGIGVNSAVFTVTHAVVFNGYPGIDRNNRLVYIDSRTASSCCLSYPDFDDWRAHTRSFEGMAVVVHGATSVVMSDARGSSET